MKKFAVVLCMALVHACLYAQNIDGIINAAEARRIETVLASDDMRGRRTFTPDIDRAGDFIAAEFKAAGLQPWKNGSFKQEFAMVNARFISASATFDGHALDQRQIIVLTTQPHLKIDEHSGYEKVHIREGANFNLEARKYARGNRNYLVLVDSAFAKNFNNLIRFKSSMFKSETSAVFVLSSADPLAYSIEATHEISEQKLTNIVGILPGKSRKNEYVIFSGHYDHLGVKSGMGEDSIFNGANDDAAGTTAVIMLAKYFSALHNNERTIVFAAFTAEEVGGFGSQYFSRQFEPDNVMAMFNIEMIGTQSKWGTNSAYITGYERTNMGEILQADLKGSAFTFYPDPYPDQNLFFRSDNATLARLGVPAHTISTSKMDNEPNYHKVSDEISTLDLDNMAMIIKAIAVSSRSIIAGTATPSRVKVDDLGR